MSIGYDLGGGPSFGMIKGDVHDIRGITYNANGGGTIVGGTAMFDDHGWVGFTAGPSAQVGLSGSYARTGAWSSREFFADFFDRNMPRWERVFRHVSRWFCR